MQKENRVQNGELFRLGDNVRLAHSFKFESFDLTTGMAKIEVHISKGNNNVHIHSALGPVTSGNTGESWELVLIDIPLSAPIFNVGHYPKESYVHPVGAGKENTCVKTAKLYEFVWKSEQESTVFCPSTGKNYKLSIDKSYLFTGRFSVIDLGRTKEVIELICPFLNKEGIEKRLKNLRGSVFNGVQIKGKLTEICRLNIHRTNNRVAIYEKTLLLNRFVQERIRRGGATITACIELYNSYTEVYLPIQLITHHDSKLASK